MADVENAKKLEGDLKLSGVSLMDEQNNALIDSVSSAASLGKTIALVGAGGSGRDEMADLLARLDDVDRGTISYGDHDLSTLPEAVTGRQISYVGGTSFVFNMTLGENLFYGLRHRPLGPRKTEGEDKSELNSYVSESACGEAIWTLIRRLTGSTTKPPALRMHRN